MLSFEFKESMYNCIIIDDEAPARELLSHVIEHHLSNKLNILAIGGSIKEAVILIQKHQPDIVFMDIEMPGENGLKIFDYYEIPAFDIIFTTAHKQYSIEALRKSAFDYLLKPVSHVDLLSMMVRYEKSKKRKNSQGNDIPFSLEPRTPLSEKIALPTSDGLQIENIQNILYCHGVDNYTRIHTIFGNNILVSKTLKALEDLLPSKGFYRIHKSYLINLNHVKSYHKNDGYYVQLLNGVELNVAYRRNEDFVKRLKNQDW